MAEGRTAGVTKEGDEQEGMVVRNRTVSYHLTQHLLSTASNWEEG